MDTGSDSIGSEIAKLNIRRYFLHRGNSALHLLRSTFNINHVKGFLIPNSECVTIAISMQYIYIYIYIYIICQAIVFPLIMGT